MVELREVNKDKYRSDPIETMIVVINTASWTEIYWNVVKICNYNNRIRKLCASVVVYT